MELAKLHPEINYIGIEKYSSVLVRALEKRPELEQVEEAGWILENHTFDLHHSDYVEGNVMTEYETKFVAEGKPINRMVIYREKK